MRSSFTIPALFCSLLSVGTTHLNPIQQPSPKIITSEKINREYDWSGYAIYMSKSTSSQSGSSPYTSEESEFFSEYQMRADISRGYGIGFSSLTLKESRAYSEWYTGNKTYGGYTSSGYAHGSDSTDIIIEFSENEEGGMTYSLFIPIPSCSGKSIKTTHDGLVSEGKIGQDEGLIQIEYQPMGSNPNLIKGEIKEKNVNENGEVTENILQWSFIKGSLDVELIVTPEAYETWLPIPGKDENTPGATMNISLKLQDKNGRKPKIKAKSFELNLINTSNEPGTTINYPHTASVGRAPDLKLIGETSINDGQTMTLIPTDGISGTAVLASYDGGGYTTLQVEAILEGGFRVIGTLNIPDKGSEIFIPKRKPGSRVAEHWLKIHNIENEDEHWDNEISPGNNHHGDGLTLYEEYRGVISCGKFKRLDPSTKELGVKMEQEDIPELQKGLNLFTAASGVKIIPFYENEIPHNRMINKNKSADHKKSQYVLHLVITDTLKGDTVGENRPVHISNKTPKLSEMTVVDITKIKSLYAEQEKAFEEAGVPPLYTEEDEIANTIAHELAHGVCVSHHGTNSAVIPRTAIKKSTPPFAIYDTYGGSISIPDEGISLVKSIGDNKSNESSGDLSCIMTYTTRYKWYFEQLPDKTLMYRMVPPMPQGKIFCTSGQGTGINATGFFGDSKKGNCLGQIRVKDE